MRKIPVSRTSASKTARFGAADFGRVPANYTETFWAEAGANGEPTRVIPPHCGSTVAGSSCKPRTWRKPGTMLHTGLLGELDYEVRSSPAPGASATAATRSRTRSGTSGQPGRLSPRFRRLRAVTGGAHKTTLHAGGDLYRFAPRCNVIGRGRAGRRRSTIDSKWSPFDVSP